MRTPARRASSLFALVVLIVVSMVAQSPPTQKASTAKTGFSISGTVVNSMTGAPVPRCRVTANLRNRRPGGDRRLGAEQNTVDTDERGRFVLPLPSAGNWLLRASATGYRPQSFEQHENFSSAVVLSEQVPRYELMFRLVPDAVVTGIILDEGNEPVRQAQVSAFAVLRAGADLQAERRVAGATTDDRGHYEIGGLAPGDYRLSVQARPWYEATNGPPANQSQLDPLLDVVYPVTWYPGSADENVAEVLTLHEGETREAGLQLLPIPAVHLRIAVPPPVAVNTSPGQGRNREQTRPPQVERISMGGNTLPVLVAQTVGGGFDVSGLAPGFYRVRMPGEDGQPGQSTIIEIHGGSVRTVDLSSATVTATVNLKFDGMDAESVPVAFHEVGNERNVFRSGGGRGRGGFQGDSQIVMNGAPGGFGGSEGGERPQRAEGASPQARGAVAARSVELPPGRYIVTQEGSSNYFIKGMALGTNEISGRLVTIPSGQSTLTLHVGEGRANVSGVATQNGKPVMGAIVLLVPTTMGQAGSITEERRAQTNTDGSFELDAVIPGQYILIAVDRGWNITWSDPATLVRYLANGVPLDLRGSSNMKQNIEAQIP